MEQLTNQERIALINKELKEHEECKRKLGIPLDSFLWSFLFFDELEFLGKKHNVKFDQITIKKFTTKAKIAYWLIKLKYYLLHIIDPQDFGRPKLK